MLAAVDNPVIRPYRPGDEPGVYAVCLMTGDSGKDATLIYHDDPMAIGHLYVGPYMKLEPELAFVLEDAQGICGYVLGTLDSEKFYAAYHATWLPALRGQYPEPAGDPSTWTPTQRIYAEYYHPEIHFPEEFHDYPSHLHIDLMPRAQGRGWGKQMMERLLSELIRFGSTGVHLAMSSINSRAEHFYRKLGFRELARVGNGEPHTLYMGRRLP